MKSASPDHMPIDFTGKRILVADDMQLNQYLIAQLLGEKGAVVVTVSDGQEAVSRCQEQRFDLIILDIRMPNLDGVETCRAIRKLNSPNALVPIVGLTAHMFEDEQVNYFSLGMNAAVTKPVEPDSFFPLLQRLLTNGSVQDSILIAATTDSELRIDLTYLLNVGNNNPSFIAMMLASFLRNTDQLQQRLTVAVDTTDLKMIGEIAHQLKFSLGVLGVKALDEKLGWLQQQALVTGVQDIELFMVRSRRLQLKLNAIIEQALLLQEQYG
ncbi:MAG: response regulator [Sphingomonadales bacterium]